MNKEFIKNILNTFKIEGYPGDIGLFEEDFEHISTILFELNKFNWNVEIKDVSNRSAFSVIAPNHISQSNILKECLRLANITNIKVWVKHDNDNGYDACIYPLNFKNDSSIRYFNTNKFEKLKIN